jgi:GGDEF domain-containing protein
MTRTILGLIAFVTLAARVSAQIPNHLREAMQSRLEAVWKKDTLVWSRLTADEFAIVVPEGKRITKAQRLAALQTEKPEPIHPIQHEEIHVYGETVLRRFVDGSEWVLEVWVRQNGSWRVVAAQVNFAKP